MKVHYFFILLVSILILSSVGVSADIVSNLTAYYSFDDGTGKDHIWNKDFAMFNVTPTSDGKRGGAIDFDGVDDNIYSNYTMRSGENFTINMWVKSTDLSSTQVLFSGDLANNIAIYQGNRSQSETHCRCTNDDGSVNYLAYAFDGGHYCSCGSKATTSFKMITYVHNRSDSTSIAIYDNGVLINVSNSGAGGHEGATQIHLGSIYDVNTNFLFDGIIDEVAIWNRSLTNADIADLYEAVTPLEYILAECGPTYTNTTLNITIFNVSKKTQQIPVELLQTYEGSVGSRSFNFSNTTPTISNFELCIFPDVSIMTDFLIEYVYEDTYYTYHSGDVNLSTNMKTLDLYVQDATSQITYNVRDDFDNDVEGALINVQSYDVGTNSFSTVEVLETDADGNAIGRAVLYTEWYRFTISTDGVTRLVEGPLKLTSDSKNFKISLITDAFDNYVSLNNIVASLGYNNLTQTFQLNYTDTGLEADEICLKVINRSVTDGDKVIVDSCESSASGQIFGLITSASVDGQLFIATGSATINDNYFVLDTKEVSFFKEWEVYQTGKDPGMGIFVSMFVIMAMMLIGIWHPVASIIMMIIGFFVMRILGIQYMEWGMFVALVLMGAIVIWKVSKRR